MSYDNNKLLSFQNAIMDETAEKISSMEQEIQDYEKAELEKVRNDEYNKMFTYMQEQVQVIKGKQRQSVTKYRLESKRELLGFRNQLSEQVFEHARAQLRSFAQTADYQTYLVDGIAQAMKDFPSETAVVLLSKEDMVHAEAIRAKTPAVSAVQIDRKNHLGGFQLRSEEKQIVLDKTFAAALEDAKQGYYASCGMSVNF